MKLKIGIGQINITAGEPEKNLHKIIDFIDRAKQEKCDVVLFPEMAVPGYLLSDLWEDTAFSRDCYGLNEDIKNASKGIAVIFGNVMVDERPSLFSSERQMYGNDGRIRKYNSVVVVNNGEYAQTANPLHTYNGQELFPSKGVSIKTNEPLYREFEDQRHFISLKEFSQQLNIPLENMLEPFVINRGTKTVKIGALICEDIWITDYTYHGVVPNPAKILAQKGAEFIVAISTSPWGWRKQGAREKHIYNIQRSLFETGHPIPLIYLNPVGYQNNGKNEYGLDGRSAVYNAFGKKVFECEAWKEDLSIVDIEIGDTAKPDQPKNFPAFKPWKQTKQEEFEDLHSALIQGVKEFCKQKGVENIVVGMSGGIDSSLVTYLSVEAIGAQHVFGVNMPTKFNSDWTKSVAKQVADTLGVAYQIVPIEGVADQVREKIAAVEFAGNFGTYNQEKKDRGVDENIQARIRSADILSGIAGKYPHTIYTSNGNKSEILFGYFTLDGDGRGALCPIGDLYKTQIIDLCVYLNEKSIATGGKVIFPWELLSPVFEPTRYFDHWDGKNSPVPSGTKKLVPSAELSEAQDVTKGKGDPIIFNYHDLLLRSFVEYRENPEDIIKTVAEKGWDGLADHFWVPADWLRKLLQTSFGTTEKWLEDLERVWKLFHIAVFKQIQSPPIISISKRALGFDFRRSQLKAHYTSQYGKYRELVLKTKL